MKYLLIFIIFLSCTHNTNTIQKAKMKNQPINPIPPVAEKIQHKTKVHGEDLIDNYFWLREKENPKVLKLIENENEYLEKTLADHKELNQKIYQEMKSRMIEDDISVPYKKGDYYYYSKDQAGKQYKVYCRKKGKNGKEEILINLNDLVKDGGYISMGDLSVSPNNKLMAYTIDERGDERFILYIKDLETGSVLKERIENIDGNIEWMKDNQRIFYITLDKELRPKFVHLHKLGSKVSDDKLIYSEKDPTYFVDVHQSEDEKYILISTNNNISSEVYFIPNDDSAQVVLNLISKRKQGLEYSISHHDGYFYILTNDNHINFRIARTKVSEPQKKHWKTFKSGNKKILLQDISLFKNYLVTEMRIEGNLELEIYNFKTKKSHLVKFNEDSHDIMLRDNYEFDTDNLRIYYNSFKSPPTVYDYDVNKEQLKKIKEKEIPGYNPKLYITKKIFASSFDKSKIPIHLIYRKDLSLGDNPLYLLGYGSYGHTYDPHFSSAIFSLLDRGFVVAIAQIRGGQEMGRSWYENGKLLKKKNTFKDFIASSEFLIKNKYVSKDKLIISGTSAGGLLVGSAMTMRPDLFKIVVARVPFVDALNTMLDSTLPLTTIEYDEWGNPNQKKYFNYIKSYSPYDNIKKTTYPHLFATAGFSDPRVTYWEPAKFVQKLRELKTDDHLAVLYTNMGAGHGGASGRYNQIKEKALEYTFILKILGE